MSITTILFDLDGTLLPMDQDVFIKDYMKRLAAKMASHGYEPKELIDTIWQGTVVMAKNNGEQTNEKAFWDFFASHYGERAEQDYPVFDEFYRVDFDAIKEVCGYTPKSAQLLDYVKGKGLRTVLATNPLFPSDAVHIRLRWAGLSPDQFERITTYENSTYSKPNLKYYEEIVRKLDLRPEECLMVGNDVDDDMIAAELGMRVFLLTDCLINKKDADIDAYPHGGFEELTEHIEKLI